MLRGARTRAVTGARVAVDRQAGRAPARARSRGRGARRRARPACSDLSPGSHARDRSHRGDRCASRATTRCRPRSRACARRRPSSSTGSPIARATSLIALGLDEAITYAFVAPRELAAFALEAPYHLALRIANPLREEQSVLRTTLLPGLLRAAARNLAHGVADVRLFEVGHVFLPAHASKEGLPEERRHVAGVLVGRREAWLKAGEPLDYFDLRGRGRRAEPRPRAHARGRGERARLAAPGRAGRLAPRRGRGRSAGRAASRRSPRPSAWRRARWCSSST